MNKKILILTDVSAIIYSVLLTVSIIFFVNTCSEKPYPVYTIEYSAIEEKLPEITCTYSENIYEACAGTQEKELYSQEDIDLMARVVMSEASTQSDDCKQAIASVILNRVRSDKYPNTVSEVVYSQNQFSVANNGQPTEDCYGAVYAAIAYPEGFPSDMYWFRNSFYHSFAYEYCKIGNTYFSTEENHI